MAKENDGRGARKALIKRGTTVLLLVAVVLVAMLLLGFFGEDDTTMNQQPRHHPRGNPRPLRDAGSANAKLQKEKEEQAQRVIGISNSLLKMFKGANNYMDKSQQNSRRQGTIFIDLEADAMSQDLIPLLAANVHLIDVHVQMSQMMEAPSNTYSGITAEFCRLEWAVHKKDPSSVPMFRHLVDASPECSRGTRYKVDLKAFTKLARAHDAQIASPTPKVLEMAGVVFHESRCGSTLVANALAAMNPAENRVYSESAPPIAALKTICGDTNQYCSIHQASQILSDIMYLMSRTDDSKEKRVFFKIQSVGSQHIEVFQTAFPHTNWIFVYRDPVQVMMSQLKQGTKYANCVRARVRPSTIVSTLVGKKGKTVSELSDEEFCAAHLATITESAVHAMQRKPHLGTPVNYKSLPDSLIQDIIPNKFGVPLTSTEIDNIKKISGVYSKGTGGRQGEFKTDSEEKDHLASTEVRAAAHLFLDESFAVLENGGLIVT